MTQNAVNPNEQLSHIAAMLFGAIVQQGYSQITVHTYTDINAHPIYYKARFTNNQGQKQIRAFYFQTAPNDPQKGAWITKEPPFAGKKPLYLLHRLANARRVWLVEGEQKADLIASLGLCATTTGGSNTLSHFDLTPLIGKECIVWADNDEAGQKWLIEAIDRLNSQNGQAGKTAKIAVVDVAQLGLPIAGDIMDYMAGLDGKTMYDKMHTLPYMTDEQIQALMHSKNHRQPAQTAPKTAPIQPPKATEEWGAPLALEKPERPENPYPKHAFTGELYEVLEAIQYFAQTPPAIAGQGILATLSAIGQRLVNAPFEYDFMPASLFLIADFPSGAGKSRASSLAAKAIHDYNKQRTEEYHERLIEYEKLIQTTPKPIQTMDKPINTAFYFSEATIEGVTDKFILDQQKDLFWSTDEAAQFFNGHSLKSDTALSNIANLVKIWDCGSLHKERSKRGKTAQNRSTAYDCRLTLNLMGQPEILEPVLNNPVYTQQGFLARALICSPPSTIGNRDFSSIERQNANPYTSPVLRAFWNKCADLLQQTPPKERFNMPYQDQHARQIHADYRQQIENAQRPSGKYAHMSAIASRAGDNMARIACLFAVFEGAHSVSAEHLYNARLLTDYYLQERLLYAEIPRESEDDAQRLSDWLVKQAIKNGNGFVGYGQMQRLAPKHLRPKAQHEPILEYLLDRAHIRIECTGRTRDIVLNPALLGQARCS